MSPVPEAVRKHFKAFKIDLRLVFFFLIIGLFLAEIMIFLPLVVLAVSLDSFSLDLQQSVFACMCYLPLGLVSLLCF